MRSSRETETERQRETETQREEKRETETEREKEYKILPKYTHTGVRNSKTFTCETPTGVCGVIDWQFLIKHIIPFQFEDYPSSLTRCDTSLFDRYRVSFSKTLPAMELG